MDQHADVAEHDHPFTHSLRNSRNALHTANYCTSRHTEERGRAMIIWDDIQIKRKKSEV